MAIQDDAKNFLLSALSRAGGDLPSLQLDWLASEGYTRGSLDERWSYYLRDNGQPPTGISWDLLGLTRYRTSVTIPITAIRQRNSDVIYDRAGNIIQVRS